MQRVLSRESEELIRDYYLVLSTKELGQVLSVPKTTVTSAMQRMGLRMPKEIVGQRRAAALRMKASTRVDPHDDLIRAEYLTTNVNQLSIKVGRSETYVKGRLKALGLVIPAEIIEQRKRDSRIQPGSAPPNKGRKQTEYMSADQIAKTAGTRFIKGDKVHNESYDGAIKIRNASKARGAGQHYMIRLAKGKWKELQIHNWEKVNGAVPKKHMLACRDGNTLNCDPNNWELITMADNARRNRNSEKARASMKKVHESGAMLKSDKLIAAYLFPRNPEAREEVLHHPELLEVKRKQIILKRTIRDKERKD